MIKVKNPANKANIITGILFPASIKAILTRKKRVRKNKDTNTFLVFLKKIGKANIPNKENIKIKQPATNSLLKNPE